jgi:hypothetical protein
MTKTPRNPWSINNAGLLGLNGLYTKYHLLTTKLSTKVYVRKNKLFMQNKAKFRKVKLNVNKVLTRNYDQMDTWSIRTTKPIKAN